jgi:hypothetical protein
LPVKADSIPGLDAKVFHYLRVGDNPTAIRTAEELWKEARDLIVPETCARWLELHDFFTAFHPYAEESSDIRRLLSGATEVCLMVATLGPALERRARDYLARRETFRGYVLDRMGSYLVEHVIRQLDARMEKQCAVRGLRFTKRYSPGYGDFRIEAQRVFVNLLSDTMPYLKMTPRGLLLPEKTVTAIKGGLMPEILSG